MFESLLHKFYAAKISMDSAGGMLVASTRDRLLVWGTVFCLIAAFSLILWLVHRHRTLGKAGMIMFLIALIIPVFVIPSVRKEYIHASTTAITVGSGPWFMPSERVLDMANVERIRELDATVFLPGNLIGDPVVNWHFVRNDGSEEIVELNEFFNAHRMVIAYYYEDRGYWLERLEDQLGDHCIRGWCR